ncbi:CHAT domain-containing protein [Winogradskyella sp. SYSU M77433]|uniref:CHAT domain-containing protein n=1 Tax=Winogradskyella sp. SYSU M77433 TaxID=3042722 RepID=UPI002481653C|nr:CHAT domain-containing protein [Winogradskyella sp. SYSU M77433]MDH7911801.1 CHAT domain-containing protein [Winogradskyella sp. SYSU M77433]
MKHIVLTFVLLLSLCTKAQNAQQAQEKFSQGYETKNVALMDVAADEYIKYNSDNSFGYIFKAFAAIAKNDLTTAKRYAKTANQMFPMESSNYTLASYIAFLEGKTSEASKFMHYAFQLSPDVKGAASTKEELDILTELTGKDFSALKTIAENAEKATAGAIQNYNDYNVCVNQWYEGKACDPSQYLKVWANYSPVNPLLKDFANATQAIAYYFAGQFDLAKPRLETAINSQYLNPYTKALCFERLTWYDRYDLNKTFLYANKGLAEIEKLDFPTLTKADLLFRKAQIVGDMGKRDDMLQLAEQLLTLATELGNDYHIINANNLIGAYYVMLPESKSISLANKHLGEAYVLASKRNFEDQKMKAAGNYAVVQFKIGNKSKAIELNNEVYDYHLKTKNWASAQNAANNIGFMFYMKNDYKNAADQFQKAVDITEQFLPKFNTQEQLYARNLHANAYSGLIMSLQKLGNTNELFKVQDMNRSRILRQKLDKSLPQITLEQAQAKLRPHEAIIYYSNGEPGQMIATLITSNSADVIEHFPVTAWLNMKKQYINNIQEKPNSINGYVTKLNEEIINGQIYRHSDPKTAFKAKDYRDFVALSREVMELSDAQYLDLQQKILKHWYYFLIQPLEAKLAGKTTLIISAEGELNAMPFEAFLDGNGKYLLERFNVKYIPSASVWASLSNRNYSEDRKPLLAMGGATYKEPQSSASNSRSTQSYFELQDQLTTKINNKQSNLSKELAALGFGGANYLPGTLREVQNLKKIIPEATVLIDGQMKESDIKRLNKSGELNQYKYVHIATHGFASNSIPELSGVMMTQPANGDGSEDTFLLAHEIAQLDLKADLAVLSACETALGKNYNGEGVNGLNSALLVAGANSTLLSLWPVNDAGTMILMTEMYNNLYVKKMSVEDAVNTAKRTMLNGVYGEQFQTPKIWAPFVLSGK